jgi:hypothetical protein
MPYDLDDLEKRLNSDQTLKDNFLNDPVQTLADEGLTLSEDMKNNLKRFVEDIKSPKPHASGSSVSQKGAVQDVGIGISIGKSF